MKDIIFHLSEGHRALFSLDGNDIFFRIQEDYGNGRWVDLSDAWIVASDFIKFAEAISQVKKLLVLV